MAGQPPPPQPSYVPTGVYSAPAPAGTYTPPPPTTPSAYVPLPATSYVPPPTTSYAPPPTTSYAPPPATSCAPPPATAYSPPPPTVGSTNNPQPAHLLWALASDRPAAPGFQPPPPTPAYGQQVPQQTPLQPQQQQQKATGGEMAVPELLEHLLGYVMAMLRGGMVSSIDEINSSLGGEVAQLVRDRRWSDEASCLGWARSPDLMMLVALESGLNQQEMSALFMARFNTSSNAVLDRVKQCPQFAKYIDRNRASVAFRSFVSAPVVPMGTTSPHGGHASHHSSSSSSSHPTPYKPSTSPAVAPVSAQAISAIVASGQVDRLRGMNVTMEKRRFKEHSSRPREDMELLSPDGRRYPVYLHLTTSERAKRNGFLPQRITGTVAEVDRQVAKDNNRYDLPNGTTMWLVTLNPFQ